MKRPNPAGTSPAKVEAETWRVSELTFFSKKTYADPFSDVSLDLVLTKDGDRLTVPAFWDGKNVWKARVALPTAGVWDCRTVCSDETDWGLHGQRVLIDCKPYSGPLEIYRRGFVKTEPEKKYLTYADGAPFFYLGDTHWSLGDETADMVKTICEKRVGQGFTVWQSEPIGAGFDLTDGVREADVPGLRAYDEKFRIIADAGLVHANAAFFFPSGMDALVRKHGGYTGKLLTGKVNGRDVSVPDVSDEAKRYLERLSRFWVARYGAWPVLWTLGQETDNDFYWEQNETRAWNALNNPYKLVASCFGKYDPYRHPLTAHMEYATLTAAYGNGLDCGETLPVYVPSAAPSAFRSVPAHTFYAVQWFVALNEKPDFGVPKDFWLNAGGKPAVLYEGRYCFLWTKNFGSRVQGWTAYLNGLCGYGWGGQDTWSYKNPYGENEESDDGVDKITPEQKQAADWRSSLGYPSAQQAGRMRAFLEDGKWWSLIPRFDDPAYFIPDEGVYAVCASDKENAEIVLYFYSFSDPALAERPNATKENGQKTGTLASLVPGGTYRYRWFDPVKGDYGAAGTFTAPPDGRLKIGDKPSGTDWALRVVFCG